MNTQHSSALHPFAEPLSVPLGVLRVAARGRLAARKLALAARLTAMSRQAAPPPGGGHVFVALCDHYEPYWGHPPDSVARDRVRAWCERLPAVFDAHRDVDGRTPRVGFFYPAEEYRPELLDMLAGLCRAGYGEVEIHLHHDRDTRAGLTASLTEFKRILRERHGLLGGDPDTGEPVYGFIHGNWALANSRPDGRWCGVDDEIAVLLETGCYADFTMPSAPDVTQTRKVNSIYYAQDDPTVLRPHDRGRDARAGAPGGPGLLMLQGPLALRWEGFRPKIENGDLSHSNRTIEGRVAAWLGCGVSVAGRPDWVFVKLHTHGAQPENIRHFFETGWMDAMLGHLRARCAREGRALHFVSPREMVNVVHALEGGAKAWAPGLLDYRLTPPSR